MESKEQKAIRLLTELVGFQNGAPLDRHKEEYDELMFECHQFLDSIEQQNVLKAIENQDAFLDSLPPTTQEIRAVQFDVLQDGDYTEDLSRENFEYIISLEGDSLVLEWEEGLGLGLYGRVLVTDDYHELELKTKLSTEEFLRRAENTFKTK